jgi:hypothetical protein
MDSDRRLRPTGPPHGLGRGRLPETTALRHLNRLSLAIVALGVLTIVAAVAGDRSPVWTLVGLMLLVAGVVKVVVVLLWRFVAQFDDPIHPDET